jgi:hypothetical protein
MLLIDRHVDDVIVVDIGTVDVDDVVGEEELDDGDDRDMTNIVKVPNTMLIVPS